MIFSLLHDTAAELHDATLGVPDLAR